MFQHEGLLFLDTSGLVALPMIGTSFVGPMCVFYGVDGGLGATVVE